MRLYSPSDMGRRRAVQRRRAKRKAPPLTDIARAFGGQFDDYATGAKEDALDRMCDQFGEGDSEDRWH